MKHYCVATFHYGVFTRPRSTPAVADAITLSPLQVRERYGPAGTKRQILSTLASSSV